MDETGTYLIDDFSSGNGISATGMQWRMFTDRVMGGVSDAEHSFTEIDGKKCLYLRGTVSLKNNGGFIQMALPLAKSFRTFDGSFYSGVRIRVRGNGEKYSIHLRTSRTMQPWQYYSAEFTATPEWQEIEIPFSRFKPEYLKAELNPAKLKRIALVAIGREFEADIALSRIEFYR